jgi:hypothetical protein
MVAAVAQNAAGRIRNNEAEMLEMKRNVKRRTLRMFRKQDCHDEML